jgi:outer membrane protein assembly factor BamD
MNRWSILLLLVVLLIPFKSPAPLVYRPDEGWSYESVGSKGSWHRERAVAQLEVAQKAFDAKNYKLALKAAKRTVEHWPLSDYAPAAQLMVARCYEARKMDERAFDAYLEILEKYPKSANIEEVQQHQYDIAMRFLGGQWFKLFGYIPFFPSMDKTAVMFDKLVKSGPYSDLAARAQMNIGAAREKEKDYPLAVKAYETAADRYQDRKDIAADAYYKAGMAYNKQAKTSEYDQNVSAQAIATFTDFATLFPEDPRVPGTVNLIKGLKTEQSRGNFQIAQFYEKRHRWQAAQIYYNAAMEKDPGSPLAEEARQRIDALKSKTSGPASANTATNTP